MPDTAVQVAVSGTDFLAAMALIDDWRSYAMSGDVRRSLAHAASEVELESVHARAAAGEWLRLFGNPLADLDAYRTAYVSGAEATAEDLRQATEAAQLAIQALQRKLRRAARVQSDPEDVGPARRTG